MDSACPYSHMLGAHFFVAWGSILLICVPAGCRPGVDPGRDFSDGPSLRPRHAAALGLKGASSHTHESARTRTPTGQAPRSEVHVSSSSRTGGPALTMGPGVPGVDHRNTANRLKRSADEHHRTGDYQAPIAAEIAKKAPRRSVDEATKSFASLVGHVTRPPSSQYGPVVFTTSPLTRSGAHTNIAAKKAKKTAKKAVRRAVDTAGRPVITATSPSARNGAHPNIGSAAHPSHPLWPSFAIDQDSSGEEQKEGRGGGGGEGEERDSEEHGGGDEEDGSGQEAAKKAKSPPSQKRPLAMMIDTFSNFGRFGLEPHVQHKLTQIVNDKGLSARLLAAAEQEQNRPETSQRERELFAQLERKRMTQMRAEQAKWRAEADGMVVMHHTARDHEIKPSAPHGMLSRQPPPPPPLSDCNSQLCVLEQRPLSRCCISGDAWTFNVHTDWTTFYLFAVAIVRASVICVA